MEEIQQPLKAKTPAAGAGSSSTPSSRSSAVAPIVDEEPFMVPEDMAAFVAAELESLQSQLETLEDENAFFKTRALGGQWSARLRFVPATDIGAYPEDKMVEHLCKLVSWPVARSFALTKFGAENSSQLAEEMCRKGCVCCAVVGGQWIGGFDFTEVARCYVSKAECSAWCDDQAVFGEAWKAANRIKDMAPERHPAAS